MHLKTTLSSLVAAALVAACGSESKAPSPQNAASELSYEKVWTTILEPQCRACHGKAGGLDVDRYDSIQAHLPMVAKLVLDSSVPARQKMPPKSTLTAAQADLLKRWLDAGAPLGKTPEIPKRSSPTLAPTFASIRANILGPKCEICHSASGRLARLPLSTPEEVKAFVEAGNAANSELVEVVTSTVQRRMPPAKSKVGPLSAEEVETIRGWIDAGAKD